MVVSSQCADTRNKSRQEAKYDQQLSVFPLPLTPLEEFLFRSDSAQAPMVIRVVLRFTGNSSLDLLADTLKRAMIRHPLLSCRIATIRGELTWLTGTPEPLQFSQSSESVFKPHSGPAEKSIDLRKTAGLHTEFIVMDDGLKIVMDAHHAVSDGNGLRQLITDWLHLHHCEVTGTDPRLPQVDPERLLQRHLFPQPVAVEPISLKDAVRNFRVSVQGRTARWLNTSRSRHREYKQAHSYCVEHLLTEDEHNQIQQRLTEWGVTLNALVMACCMSTFAESAPRGSMQHRVSVLNPTDLRLPSDRTLPAANRFGIAFLRRRRSDCCNQAELLRGLHDEMLYVRTNYIGGEFIKGVTTLLKIPGGMKLINWLGWFVPSLQWTCLGDVTRGARRLMIWKEGVLRSGGLQLETATAFAALTENAPLSVAACEAGRRVTLTVRSSPQFMTIAQTESFAQTLLHQLCNFELPPKSHGVPSVKDKSEC